jgi:hypothetical protein
MPRNRKRGSAKVGEIRREYEPSSRSLHFSTLSDNVFMELWYAKPRSFYNKSRNRCDKSRNGAQGSRAYSLARNQMRIDASLMKAK